MAIVHQWQAALHEVCKVGMTQESRRVATVGKAVLGNNGNDRIREGNPDTVLEAVGTAA